MSVERNIVLPVKVDATKVDVVREEPASVENALSDNPGTLILDAFRVDTVRVLFTNMVFDVRVEMAMVDAMREDPVSVENALSDNPGTLIVDAFRVDTVRVDATFMMFTLIVELDRVDVIDTVFAVIMDPSNVL